MTPPPDPSTSSTRAVSRKTVLHGLLALGGLVAMFYLLIEQPARGPLLVAVVGAVLVWPLRSVPAARPIVLALGIVIGAFLLSRLGGVLAPFIAVFVLAYLLDPVVTWAHTKRGLPRWASTAVLTLVAINAVVTTGVFLIPALLDQIKTFASGAVELALQIPDWVERSTVLDGIEEAGLIDRNALVSELATFLPSQIQSAAGQIPALVTASSGRSVPSSDSSPRWRCCRCCSSTPSRTFRPSVTA